MWADRDALQCVVASASRLVTAKWKRPLPTVRGTARLTCSCSRPGPYGVEHVVAPRMASTLLGTPVAASNTTSHRLRRSRQGHDVMPKQKTHSGAKDRFRVTRKGKVLHGRQNRRHLLEKKSSSRKRRLSGTGQLSGGDAAQIRKLLSS
jgi:large subunit ribosomal protein L35